MEDLIPIGDIMHSIIAFFFVWMPSTLWITVIVHKQPTMCVKQISSVPSEAIQMQPATECKVYI